MAATWMLTVWEGETVTTFATGGAVRFGKKKTAVYRVSKDGTRLVWAADHRGAKA